MTIIIRWTIAPGVRPRDAINNVVARRWTRDFFRSFINEKRWISSTIRAIRHGGPESWNVVKKRVSANDVDGPAGGPDGLCMVYGSWFIEP